jgi:hypothetical protein
MMASSQCYTQAAVLQLNLSKNHNYITCFGIDLVEEYNKLHLEAYEPFLSRNKEEGLPRGPREFWRAQDVLEGNPTGSRHKHRPAARRACMTGYA